MSAISQNQNSLNHYKLLKSNDELFCHWLVVMSSTLACCGILWVLSLAFDCADFPFPIPCRELTISLIFFSMNAIKWVDFTTSTTRSVWGRTGTKYFYFLKKWPLQTSNWRISRNGLVFDKWRICNYGNMVTNGENPIEKIIPSCPVFNTKISCQIGF